MYWVVTHHVGDLLSRLWSASTTGGFQVCILMGPLLISSEQYPFTNVRMTPQGTSAPDPVAAWPRYSVAPPIQSNSHVFWAMSAPL